MSRTASPSTQKLYSLVRVCRVWRLRRSTVVLAASPQRRQPAPRRDQDRAGHVPIMTWSNTSKASWPRPRFMGKAIARSGPGCVMPASEPLKGGCCG